MPAVTKLSASSQVVELENAGKVIKEHLQADASRVPELDVALIGTGGILHFSRILDKWVR
jgi:hypothetical protein